MATNINASAAQSGDMLEKLYGEAQNLANANANAETQIGQDRAMVAKTTGMAQLETQRQNLEAATALGTNMNDSGYILGQLASDMRMLYRQRDDAILATQAATQKNIFTDGPLAWLDAQLALPQLQMQQQTSEARLVNAQSMYKQVSDLTQESAQTNLNIQQTKTVSSVEAEANALLLDAQTKANAAKIQGIQLGAQGIKEAQNMRQQIFNNNLQLAQEARANESMALARENAARQREAHSLAIAEKKANDKTMATYLDGVNSYRASIGQAPIDQATLKIKLGSAAGKAEMDNAFEFGLVVAQTGRQVLGGTPAEAMFNIAQTPGAKIAPGTTALFEKLSNITQTAANGPNIKNNQQRVSAVNEAIAAEAKKQQSGAIGRDSIYSPPPLTTLVDAEIQRLPITQKLLKPALDSGTTEFNPRALLPQALELVKKGELSLNDAILGVSALGKKAVAYNNGYYNYDGVGIPRQNGLNMKMEATKAASNRVGFGGADTFSFFGSAEKIQVVNIADEAAVGAYANKYMAGQISVNLQEAAKGNVKTKK